MKLLFFQTVKSKVIISLFETVRLSVSISLRNLYNSSNSIKDFFFFIFYSLLFSIMLTVTDRLSSKR